MSKNSKNPFHFNNWILIFILFVLLNLKSQHLQPWDKPRHSRNYQVRCTQYQLMQHIFSQIDDFYLYFTQQRSKLFCNCYLKQSFLLTYHSTYVGFDPGLEGESRKNISFNPQSLNTVVTPFDLGRSCSKIYGSSVDWLKNTSMSTQPICHLEEIKIA